MPALNAATVMRLVAMAATLALLVLILLTPERAAVLQHGQAALDAEEVARLGFARLGLGLVAAGILLHALLHRHAAGWLPFQRLLFALPLCGIAFVAAYKAAFGVRDAKYLRLIREDGPVEYLTAVVFLVAAGVAAWALLRARDGQTRAFLALLAVATAFVGLSEVSFGQRLFGIETPEAFAEINRQGEITLHNIRGVDGVVYMILPLVLLGYALLGAPVARAVGRSGLGRYFSADLLRIAPAPWYAVPAFLPMALFCLKAWANPDHVWQDQEPAELALSLGFLLIASQAVLLLKTPALKAPALKAPALKAPVSTALLGTGFRRAELRHPPAAPARPSAQQAAAGRSDRP